MKIIFEANGTVDEIISTDETFIQGSVNANTVYAHFKNRDLAVYNVATITFERSDGQVSPELAMALTTFSYVNELEETVTVNGFSFLFYDDWILACSGTLRMTIKLYNASNVIAAQGLVTAAVLPSVESEVITVTPDQLAGFLASLADKRQLNYLGTFASLALAGTALASGGTPVNGLSYEGIVSESSYGLHAQQFFATWDESTSSGTMLAGDNFFTVNSDGSVRFQGKIGAAVKYVKSSEILAKGDVVQFVSATGGFTLVKKAVPAEVNVKPQLVLGFAMQAFTANGFGFIITEGILYGVNTSAATGDGVIIYADTSNGTAGAWMETRPVAPNAVVVLGMISNCAVNGSINVRLSFIPLLRTLSDVYAPSLAQDNVLKWNATLGRFEVTQELAFYKYLGSFATADLAVASVSAGSTGVLYECLINGVPYEAIKSSTGNVQLVNLSSNKSTFYSNGVITGSRDGMFVYNAQPVDSPANTVPEIYRNSFRPIMTAANIGSCMVTRGSYGGVATASYAYIFIVSEEIAIITVEGRTWKYAKTADTFTEYYLLSSDAQSTYLAKAEAQSTYVALAQKGAANGVAPLGSDSKIASTYLPAYVDDVIEYANLASFPVTGSSGIIYVALDTNKTYRWSGSTYIEISASLALGETDSTAYRGDRGKIAYEHSLKTDNPHSVTKSQVGLGNVDNTSDLNKPISTATQTALDAKAGKFYATNLITNGNFANGSTGWTLESGISVSAETLVFNVASGNYKATQLFTGIVGNKYYVSAKLVSYTSGTLSFRSAGFSGSTTEFIGSGSSAGIKTALLTCTQNTGLVFVTSLTTGFIGTLDNILIIDLTALYGAGSEPTQVEMDKYLAQKFTNSYFDGTVEYATLADITGNKANVIKATNLVTNGNFVTPWTAYGSLTTNTVSNNEATVLVTTQYSGIQRGFSAINGHIYYAYCQLKSAISQGVDFKIRYNADNSLTFKTSNGSGTYEFISMIATMANANSSSNIAITDGKTTGFQNIYVKYAGIIDLTATFGAGKEPTVEQMNANLAFYPNSWFDGTIPFINLYTLNATKANRQQEDWLTPTVTNGTNDATSPVQYFKDGFGIVHFRGKLTRTSAGIHTFTMPTGYRAGRDMSFPTFSGISTFSIIFLASGYLVYCDLPATSSTVFNFDGISYRAV